MTSKKIFIMFICSFILSFAITNLSSETYNIIATILYAAALNALVFMIIGDDDDTDDDSDA